MLYDSNINAGNNARKQFQLSLVDLGYNIDIDGTTGSETIKAVI